MHPRDPHEQEEDIFDDDEDDTMRVRLSKWYVMIFKYRKKISDSKKFVPQKISDVKFSDITSVRK